MSIVSKEIKEEETTTNKKATQNPKGDPNPWECYLVPLPGWGNAFHRAILLRQ